MKKIYSFTLIFCLFAFSGFAQEECPMEIGTNLYPADEQVFKDLKLVSSHFYTKNENWVGDGNDWDSGLINVIPQDENGYPTINIPFTHPSVSHPQTCHFLTATSGIYPTGHYILTFEGTGIVAVSDWSNAENIVQINPNRIEFDINTTSESGIHVEIRESLASDHVRNISIVHQDDFDTYISQPFREEFVQLADNFANIRFMDWMATNKLYYQYPPEPYDPSTISWSDRVIPTYHIQNREERGLAYEYVIMLANQLGKDIWINIPHQADVDFINNMAELFFNNLNSSSTVYVEFSNEVWNSIFQQADYVRNEGPYPDDLGRNLGWFSDRVFGIWKDVYGSQSNRLKFVIAGHDWVCVDALSVMDNMPDVASFPGYFYLSNTHWAELEALGASATATDVTSRAAEDMPGSFYWMNQFKELVCDPNDLDFVMYEGGQHLLRLFGVEETFQEALYAAQISPEMQDLYITLLTYCRDELGVTLFNHFTLYGPNESLWGSWGMVESVYETPDTPKYHALMEFACNSMSTETFNPTAQGLKVYPNPANDVVNLVFDENFTGTVTLYNLNGQKLITKDINATTAQLSLNGLPKGVYLVRCQNAKTAYTAKIIKQ